MAATEYKIVYNKHVFGQKWNTDTSYGSFFKWETVHTYVTR